MESRIRQTSLIRTKESGAVIMRKGSGTRRTAVGRFASVMAAVGALLISSGIALMAAPTTASAAQFKHEGPHKVVVCKYVGTPPGVLDHVIIVSVNSMPTGFSGTFP